MDAARAYMSFRDPCDTVELRLLLEIRDQMQAPAEESNEPAPASAETQVPELSRFDTLKQGMSLCEDGPWIFHADLERYVQARIAEALAAHEGPDEGS